LLHDVFDTPFPDVARMLERSEAACRQLASRARRAVRDERAAPSPVAPEAHARLLDAFSHAAASGDLSALAGLLSEDAVLFTDGGGRKTAALNPIISAEKILRFFAGIAGKNAGRAVRLLPMMINGSAGAVVYMDDEIDHALSLAVDGGKITAIYLVRNPDKLRHVAAMRPPHTLM